MIIISCQQRKKALPRWKVTGKGRAAAVGKKNKVLCINQSISLTQSEQICSISEPVQHIHGHILYYLVVNSVSSCQHEAKDSNKSVLT